MQVVNATGIHGKAMSRFDRLHALFHILLEYTVS